MTTFEQAEREYYEPPDDKEYDYCECCQNIECKIFNGQHICEDCVNDLELIKWIEKNETEENL
jgi:hypothetical protein